MRLRSFIPFCTITALAALGSLHAIASDFSYHHVQISQSVTTDNNLSIAIDHSVTGVSGSYEINKDMAITAGYFSGSYQPLPIDSRDLEAGITLHTPIKALTDFMLNASLLQSELQTPFGSAVDSGHRLKAGIRHRINYRLEFEACFSQLKIFNDTDNLAGIGLLFDMSSDLSLAAEYGLGDNIGRMSLALRLGF